MRSSLHPAPLVAQRDRGENEDTSLPRKFGIDRALWRPGHRHNSSMSTASRIRSSAHSAVHLPDECPVNKNTSFLMLLPQGLKQHGQGAARRERSLASTCRLRQPSK
jgi:hypothetical protein